MRDLGAAVLPLARGLASVRLPVLRAPEPVFLSWALTEACNLACAHCSMNRPLPDELDHARRLEVARRIAASGVWGVSMIGGEPLLVRELFEYARILKAAGKRVFVGTSGDRLGRHVDDVLDAGIDVVTVSIDGDGAEAHDAFRKRVGLFSRVVDAVDALRARRRGDAPRVQVRCTLNRRNSAIDRVFDFWAEHADNVLLQAVQDNCLHQVRDRSCLFLPEDRAEFDRVYASLRARYGFLRGRHYDLLPRYLFEREALFRDLAFRCLLVPAVSAIVEANGRVKLCHGRPDSDLGALLDAGSLARVWSTEHADEARARMQSKDYGCMCWEPSYARNLDLLAANQLVDSLRDLAASLVDRR